MGYTRNKLLGRAILGNLFDSLGHSVIFVEQRTKNFKPISAQYIQNNYGIATGIATPPGPELLTFPCVTHNISWLLSRKMWQPVMLEVRFLPYTKGQYLKNYMTYMLSLN